MLTWRAYPTAPQRLFFAAPPRKRNTECLLRVQKSLLETAVGMNAALCPLPPASALIFASGALSPTFH